MSRDKALDDAHAAWLSTQRPRHAPASSRGVLAAAEDRLRGAIAHDETRGHLEACAERVRRAHLGVVKAELRVYDLPTELHDAAIARHRERLIADQRAWQAITVDGILARYR